MPNEIIPYEKHLRKLARELRNNMTFTERKVWERIKGRRSGWEFHRQVPLLKYIVDFYCHELKLGIEIDGKATGMQRGPLKMLKGNLI